MEDVESPPAPDDNVALPEGNADPGDPLNPGVEEEHNPNPPMVNPTEDVELTGENEVDRDDNDSDDNASDALSDVDEAQFEDFDVANIAIEDRPAIDVDEDNLGVIGVHKRKRTEDGDGSSKKKKREGRREKKSRRRRDEEEDLGGETGGERRSRKKKDRLGVDDDPNLPPEERRKRALEKKMDAAARRAAGGGRGGKKGLSLADMGDEEIGDMRTRMTNAAAADTAAREKGEPAMRKLQMLPDVVALLNKNTYRNQLADPELNLLEAVRFFLEPLNDGSLPAYEIQREMFNALGKLPIDKESLIASGIGKVVLFYTKSTRPQPTIKRQAEKLMADWTRPILRRTDDYRKKEVAKTDFDPRNMPIRGTQAPTQQQLAEAARKKALATPIYYNRARREDEHLSYTIAPRSNIVPSEAPKQSKNPFTLKVQRGKR